MTRHLTQVVGFEAPANDDSTDYENAYLDTATTDYLGSVFRPALGELDRQYGVAKVPVAYWDGIQNEWQPTDRGVALVNPAWMGDDYGENYGIGSAMPQHRRADMTSDPDDAAAEMACWHIPTSDYSPAGPLDVLSPLANAISNRDISEPFGEMRFYRDGGEFHVDLFFTDFTVDVPERDREIVLGLTVRSDYFGSSTINTSVIGFDTGGQRDATVMRQLTDSRKRRHVGSSTDDVSEWWGTTLSQLETVSETLYSVIAEAMEYTVPLDAYPCSLTELLQHSGLPERIANATDGTTVQLDGSITAWQLHRYAMAAIQTAFDGKTSGSAFASHVSAANRWLFNPAGAESAAIDGLQHQTRIRQASDTDTVADNVVRSVDALDDRAVSIAEGIESFRSTRDKLKTMLSDIDTDEHEQSGTDGADSDDGADEGNTASDSDESDSDDAGPAHDDETDADVDGDETHAPTTDGGWVDSR